MVLESHLSICIFYIFNGCRILNFKYLIIVHIIFTQETKKPSPKMIFGEGSRLRDADYVASLLTTATAITSSVAASNAMAAGLTNLLATASGSGTCRRSRNRGRSGTGRRSTTLALRLATLALLTKTFLDILEQGTHRGTVAALLTNRPTSSHRATSWSNWPASRASGVAYGRNANGRQCDQDKHQTSHRFPPNGKRVKMPYPRQPSKFTKRDKRCQVVKKIWAR